MKTSRIIIYALLISFFGCQSEPHSPTTSPYKFSESFIDKLNEQYNTEDKSKYYNQMNDLINWLEKATERMNKVAKLLENK